VNVGVIGCGYVFDHYLATWSNHPGITLRGVADIDRHRAAVVGRTYDVHVYDSVAELLADPGIDIVANLTSIQSHYEVSRDALRAGKHVYSEKPLTACLDQARELIELADALGLRLSCAPSNALSDTTQTMWKVIRDGAVGEVRLVYAEFDDNPIYLMHPEGWRSRSGAPWPYLHEYEMGCTWEHVGYHLTWLCSLFGPVATVTAFAKQTLPDKTDQPLHPATTPDFSVACLDFSSGVTARVTCSIGAPYDHRMRVIGNEGMVWADTYRHYRSPVHLERFSPLSLNARKVATVRRSPVLQRLLGVNGRRVPLARAVPPGSPEILDRGGPRWSPTAVVGRLKRRELGQQDKAIGLAELADAIESDRPHFPPPDLTLHLTELTLAIQAAGTDASTYHLTTTFDPVAPRDETLRTTPDYAACESRGLADRLVEPLIARAHRH
jgi:predicted dehydrogenase